MKNVIRHIIFLFIGLMAFYSASAQTPQQRFDQANQLYQNQKYDSALFIYSRLIKEGYHNPDLYFNAGNASYRLKHSGYAVYYYTKALQEKPGNKEYTHNLNLAQLQATNKIQQLPTLFFVRWWHVALHFFNVNTWLIFSIIFFWILLFIIGWNRLAGSPKKLVRKLQIPLAVLFCFFFLGAVFSLKAATTHDAAIIVSAGHPLKEAPDQNSTSVETLQLGSKVAIIDSVADWKKVKLTDGTEGWVNISGMKIL